eukprot:gene12403-6070_t
MSQIPKGGLIKRLKNYWRFYNLNKLLDKHKDKITMYLNIENLKKRRMESDKLHKIIRETTRSTSKMMKKETEQRTPSSARKITNLTKTKLNIKLYQYEACPFSHKVRAYLKYKKLDFETVEVNPFSKQELSFSKDYKKVPVAVINDIQINNSYDIIQYIRKELNEQVKDEKTTDEWNEFADKKLAVTLLPNLYKNYSDALEAFNYISRVPNWNLVQRIWLKYFGAFFMRMLKKRLMKKYGLKGNDPRISLYELIDSMNFRNEYLNGDEMTESDVIIFGIFSTVSNLKTGRDIFEHNKKLREWFDRVNKRINF